MLGTDQMSTQKKRNHLHLNLMKSLLMASGCLLMIAAHAHDLHAQQSPATIEKYTPTVPLLRPLPVAVTANYRAVDDFALSPNGEFVAIETSRIVLRNGLYARGDSRLVIRRLTDGQETIVAPPPGQAGEMSSGSWSPDGRYLAYISYQNNRYTMAIWDTIQRRSFVPAPVQLGPYAFMYPVQWSPDSRKILLREWAEPNDRGVASRLPHSLARYDFDFPTVPKDAASVIVFNTGGKATAQKNDPQPLSIAKDWFVNLATVDVLSGKLETIATREFLGTASFSPDGRWIVYAAIRPSPPDQAAQRCDLIAFDQDVHQQKTLVKYAEFSGGDRIAWAPDGHRFAFVVRAALETKQVPEDDGQMHIADVASGRIETVSNARTAQFNLPHSSQPSSVWSSDGEYLYDISHDNKVWRVTVQSHEMKEITLPEGQIPVQILAAAIKTSLSDAGMYIVTREGATHMSSIYSVDANGVAVLVRSENGAIGASSVFDARDRSFLYTLQNASEPGDLWIAPLDHGATSKITHEGAEFDAVRLGESRVISFLGKDGITHKAALLLPPSYGAGQRLPLVVWVYGGDNGSEAVDKYGFWGTGNFDMQVLATRGYAVLYPDIALKSGSPMHDIEAQTMEAVDAVIDQGIADPSKLAIMGQSFGSYSVLANITQTDRFKAAVISSVTKPDVLADYLYMSTTGQGAATAYYEHGQARIGATPWEHPERYIENSPIWKFDKISTPVLIGLGSEDGATNFDGAEEVFVALQRLDKEAEFRLYKGEGHGFVDPANVTDWWNRRIDFLDEKLGVVRDTAGMMLMPPDGKGKK